MLVYQCHDQDFRKGENERERERYKKMDGQADIYTKTEMGL